MGNLRIITDHFTQNPADIHISYSNAVRKEVDYSIKQKVVSIANSIYQSLPEDEQMSVEHIDFQFDDSNTLGISIAKADGEEVSYQTDFFETDSEIRCMELSQLVVASLSRAVPLEPASKAPPGAGPVSHLFQKLRAWIATIFIIEPAIRKYARHYFSACKDEMELESKWKKDDPQMPELIKALYSRVNQGQEIISESKLDEMVHKALGVQFQKTYKDKTGRILNALEMKLMQNQQKLSLNQMLFTGISKEEEGWNENHSSMNKVKEELKRVDNRVIGCENILHGLEEQIEQGSKDPDELEEWQEELNNFSQTLDKFREKHSKLVEEVSVHHNFDESQFKSLQHAQHKWEQMIDAMPAIEIPMDYLAAIPINVYSEQSLLNTWIKITDDLKRDGSLNKIGESKDPALIHKQTLYGDHFLLAIQLMPAPFRSIIQPEDEALALKIEKSIRAQPNAMELKSLPRSDGEKKQQRIYQGIIRPVVDEGIEELLKDNLDFVSIAEMLATPESEKIMEWVKKIELKLDLNNITKDERGALKLMNEDLARQVIGSIEKVGMEKYFISGEQILLLQNLRKEGEEHPSLMLQGAENFKKLKEEVDELSENLDEDEIVQFKSLTADLIRGLPLVDLDLSPLMDIVIAEYNEAALVELWGTILMELKAQSAKHAPDSYDRLKNELQDTKIKNFLLFSASDNETFVPRMIARIEEIDGPLNAGDNIFDLSDKMLFQTKLLFKTKPTLYNKMYGEIQVPSQTEPALNEQYLLPYEISNLKILTKASANLDAIGRLNITAEEMKQMKGFLEYAMRTGPENKALNKKLYEMLEPKKSGLMQMMLEEMLESRTPQDERLFQKVPFGISKEVVQLIVDVTYKLRNQNEFEPLTQKLSTLLHKVQNKEEILERDKMSIRELGTVKKFADLSNDIGLFTKLEALGLLDERLMPLTASSKAAQLLLDQLNELFQEQLSYRPGDLMAHLGPKEFAFKNHKLTARDKLHIKLVTPYTHAAKVYHKYDGEKSARKMMLSHVVGAYANNEFDMTEDSYSEIWRIDISALIPKRLHPILQQIYGEHWKEGIQKKFEALENRIHENRGGRFNEISNPWSRRFEAGKADYIWGGHSRKTEQNFNELADEIAGEHAIPDEHLKEMICSEFVTKTTITSLVKLNEYLSAVIGEYLIQNGKAKEGEALKIKRNVFKLPYSKYEKLQAVHPGRMLQLLKSKNCLYRIPHAPIVRQLIKTKG